MTADVNSNLKVQIAHVLAMDVVEVLETADHGAKQGPCRADPDCEGDRADSVRPKQKEN